MFQVQCIDCHRWSKPAAYLIKHEAHPRISIRKCGISRKYYLCLSCLKKGKGNPMYGECVKNHMTKEAYKDYCKRISISMSGKNNPMYGKNIKDHMTEEAHIQWKQHLKDANNRIQSDPIKRAELKKKLSDAQYEFQAKNPEYYSEIKSRGGKKTASTSMFYRKTKPEIAVEKWLIDNKINYEYSPIMSNGKRSFQFDFIIRHRKILIEVNGDYWHGNPRIYEESKLNFVQKNKREADKKKKDFAEMKGFKLLVIWEYDINHNDFSALDFILQTSTLAHCKDFA